MEELHPRFATPDRRVGTAPPARSSDSSARYLKRTVKRIAAFCAPFELDLQYYPVEFPDALLACGLLWVRGSTEQTILLHKSTLGCELLSLKFLNSVL